MHVDHKKPRKSNIVRRYYRLSVFLNKSTFSKLQSLAFEDYDCKPQDLVRFFIMQAITGRLQTIFKRPVDENNQ